MKTCPKCKQEKSLDLFGKLLKSKDGYSYICKKCHVDYMKEYYKKPKAKEYLASYSKKYVAKNKEKLSLYYVEWKDKNKQHLIDYDKDRYNKNKHLYTARVAKRKAMLLKATPSWADQDKIKMYYGFAKAMDFCNPFSKHHVDHIVPLQGKLVCGLHTHNNLQVLTAGQNLSKGAKFNN